MHIRHRDMPCALFVAWAAACALPIALLADDPDQDVLQSARKAMDEGRFAEAEKMLRATVEDAQKPVTDPLHTQLEILRRTRYDYSQTEAQLLDKLRESIPDVTTADLERWRKNGQVQHRIIDGKIAYFRREPSNLFRFCDEAIRRRRGSVEPAGSDFSLPVHISNLLKIADRTGETEILPVKHEVTYRITIPSDHPRLRDGALVRCWLPYPQQYRQQKEVKLLGTAPAQHVLAPNGHPQRSIYFEQVYKSDAGAAEFEARFEFVTRAFCPKLDPQKVEPFDLSKDAAILHRYTTERPPHIRLTPDVMELAKNIVGDETNPLLKARKIFRWVSDNIRYCAEMEYSTIDNLSGKALRTRKGDCGVQAMTFITLCRAAGVPARWQSGWESLPNEWNMHDWAEFYVKPWGWLPADPSYGIQRHPNQRVQEFYCGHLDPYRMIVNLDFAQPFDPPKTSFRSEPTDFQRGEVEIDGHNLYFGEWDWDMTLRTTVLDDSLIALRETLDGRIPQLLKDGRVPGAVVAVGRRSKHGFEILLKAYGYLQTQPSLAPMREDAVFDLASMTKPIATGTSLMVLIDQGKISLSDPISKYVSQFSGGKKSEATLAHLVTHRSGLKSYLSLEERKELASVHGFTCPDPLRKHVCDLDLSNDPGDTVVYSCLNAIVAARIVEKVGGLPLDRFTVRHVFKPLRMWETGFNPPQTLARRMVPTTVADRGRGEGGFLLGQVHDPIAAMQGGVSGNAGLFSTAADLGRYARMILNRGELDGQRVLSQDAVDQFIQQQTHGAVNANNKPADRAVLWDVYPERKNGAPREQAHAIGHTGYTGTAIRIYPQDDFYVILLTNRVHPDDTGKVTALRNAVWDTVVEHMKRKR